jgi:pentatricopeptide repeat protein
MRDAYHTFEEIEVPDVVSWSGMIAAYAQYGCGERAVALLRRMQMRGTFPNEVTLVNILYACSHAGLVRESTYIFLSLSRTDPGAQIPLVFDHYNCIVDLFGRIGRLAEGEKMILSMPFQPTSTMWMTLLSACKTHNDVGCAQQAVRQLSELDPFNATACIVSYNIYKSAEQFS